MKRLISILFVMTLNSFVFMTTPSCTSSCNSSTDTIAVDSIQKDTIEKIDSVKVLNSIKH